MHASMHATLISTGRNPLQGLTPWGNPPMPPYGNIPYLFLLRILHHPA